MTWDKSSWQIMLITNVGRASVSDQGVLILGGRFTSRYPARNESQMSDRDTTIGSMKCHSICDHSWQSFCVILRSAAHERRKMRNNTENSKRCTWSRGRYVTLVAIAHVPAQLLAVLWLANTASSDFPCYFHILHHGCDYNIKLTWGKSVLYRWLKLGTTYCKWNAVIEHFDLSWPWKNGSKSLSANSQP